MAQNMVLFAGLHALDLFASMQDVESMGARTQSYQKAELRIMVRPPVQGIRMELK